VGACRRVAGALAGVVLTLAGLLPTLAHAQPRPPDAEFAYWEAQLAISSRGDLREAIAAYRGLLADARVRSNHALRARVLEALGRAHWSLSELEAAREAFEACHRLESSGQTTQGRNCVHLARQVNLEQGAIRSIPSMWTFEEDTTHGFVLFSDQGTMRREGGRTDGVLVWTQELDPQTVADLAVGMDVDGDPPSGMRLTVQSPLERTVLDLVLVDELGRTYEAETVFGADEKVREWEIDFTEMQPRLPSWPELDRSRISSVHLRASRPPLSEGRARHRILLDDISFY